MNSPAQFLPAKSSEIESSIIDRAMILDRVGGDEELLREIAAIFLDEYPSLLQEIQAAVVENDAKRLERAAHSLKGSVSNFGAQGATQAAYVLESLGRRGEMQQASGAVTDLIAHFDVLQPALQDLAS